MNEPDFKPHCPNCRQELTHEVLTEQDKAVHSIFCPHGNCDSDACNQDHRGNTLAEALKSMNRAFEREMDSLNKDGKAGD